MCSGSEAGSYLRLIDIVHHSTLGLRVIKKKRKDGPLLETQIALLSHLQGLLVNKGLQGYLGHKKTPPPRTLQ